MRFFIQRWAGHILGTLSGWDRLRFRGTKRWLAHAQGLFGFLWQRHVLLKDFGTYAESISKQLRAAIEVQAKQHDCPVRYLTSSATSKEEVVQDLLRKRGPGDGLVAVLSCVEPCQSFELHRNRDTKHLQLRPAWRKCLHYYHYYRDPQWGLMQVRLQTWLPFNVHVVLNGRERLARQMDAAGIGYVRRDNCFTAIADLEQAQLLADAQLRTDWAPLLESWARQVNPIYDDLFGDGGWPYYWSADQSEWASDVLFRSPAALAAAYPRWLHYGIEQLSSCDVLRFLGRKLPNAGLSAFAGEVVSDLKERSQGIRLKHRLNANSIKMYDKQGSVLRIETTLNDAADIRVYRAKEGDDDGPKSWRPMRKGIADMHRRAEVCQQSNERYLEALATVADPTTLHQATAHLCRPVRWHKQRARALNPLAAEDAALLTAVNRGEYVITGFRNRDLRQQLYGDAPTKVADRKRQSAAVTRKLRLLRAHALIRKVPKTHRYQITEQGRVAISAVLAARQADTAKLTQVA
jgi:hypothetical protein